LRNSFSFSLFFLHSASAGSQAKQEQFFIKAGYFFAGGWIWGLVAAAAAAEALESALD
jgi:hypothetical protein